MMSRLGMMSDFRLFIKITIGVFGIIALVLSVFFNALEAYLLSRIIFILSLFFLCIWIAGFFVKDLIMLSRTGTIIAEISLFFICYYTGGIQSPYLTTFLVPAFIPFFYKPYSDRYIFTLFTLTLPFIFFFISEWTIPNQIKNEYFLLHKSISLVLTFGGVLVFTGVLRNVIVYKNRLLKKSMTNLKDTIEELIQIEKMASLGILSSGVAHEINNPLNFIKNGVFILKNKIKSITTNKNDEELDVAISAINNGIIRTEKIVSSLSYFSRSTHIMHEECDVNAILQNCITMLRHKIEHKSEIIEKLTNESARIYGNNDQLHQAFLNIIINAEQAIEKNGEIYISTQRLNEFLRITIKDNGKGIKKDHLYKISDPFFTTKPVGSGTGLGLSISFNIIEKHMGVIQVQSEVTKGTSFEILLPVDRNKTEHSEEDDLLTYQDSPKK